ncbi:replication initiation protein [Campylobacter sp. RM12327]|nr:replication initiation protein [Campylobacter sp. RM11302]MBF6668665.1 replication initiation protein [Campylobacter sp. RM12327]MBF6674079.1 replication initiation protein [Campylobacter sp. RM13538]MBF6675548.1 replication initiation protein [Campylobacter sp. RM12321]MBF6677378.1 replication initiation protein [Campylobacter sp. RM11259]
MFKVVFEGDEYIKYKLNDSLMQYLINLEKNFTQLNLKIFNKCDQRMVLEFIICFYQK